MGVKLSSIRRAPVTQAQEVPLPDVPGVTVTIVPSNDIAYRQASTASLQPSAKQLRAGRLLDPATQDRATAIAVAQAMLKGWSGIDDEVTGEPVPYSPEKAMEMALDPEFADFFAAVAKEGDALAEKIAEERKQLGKS